VQHRQKSGISALNLKRLLEIGSYQTAWWEANSQQAVNQTVSGVRVRSKMVRAVGELRDAQATHSKRPSPSLQPPRCTQPRQTNPPGQRSHSK
jgi:hypothetical protein